ncbi:acetyl-CoA C-acetyltransferase [Risungbinella massiliensis]|uniref:acetyl-CoA C-acetyltransferase n=1 Tax=Risungbinella massiliensis TaxID=1329796 RepID=UPI0005CC8E63|nr:acetyl-CoA C-acetyltransferase [Risungbinella massiliensis]
MRKTVIVAGARTPIGKFGGGLSTIPAVELGAATIREALLRAKVSGDQLDEVIMGMVLQGGNGQIPSRQAAVKAGIPWSVGTETVNKVCASGMRSVTLADQIIRAGDGDLLVAGGMESMSQAPYVLPSARFGYKMGHGEVTDLMLRDGLLCAFENVHMIHHGNYIASKYEISREQQDDWALRSHLRAQAAVESGKFAEEIVAVEIKGRKGTTTIAQDESIRPDSTLEKLAALRPALSQDGSITAGNAPGVNDGAAALILASEERALELGLDPIAEIVGHAAVAMEARDFPTTPAFAIQKLLQKHGLTLDQIDLFEVNEAFAAVTLVTGKLLGWDQEKVNVNGGAVALGHPIGASGTRILLTLAQELQRRGGGLGVAAICSGAGQGDAVLIRVS